MLRVALTGNIASGKSAVAEVWRRMGACVVDADEMARRAVEPGSEGLAAVVAEFGPGVVAEGGGLDRAALRGIAFRDDSARRRLEALLHPIIGRLRSAEDERIEASGARVVVHVIPLLFEVGLEDDFDVIVLVDAPESERARRLRDDRGLEAREADRMIAAQMPAREKRARADILIENDGTFAQLTERAAEVWRELEQRSA